jgi:hypothetical protein
MPFANLKVPAGTVTREDMNQKIWSATPPPDSGPTGTMRQDGDGWDGYDTEEVLPGISGRGCENGAGI